MAEEQQQRKRKAKITIRECKEGKGGRRKVYMRKGGSKIEESATRQKQLAENIEEERKQITGEETNKKKMLTVGELYLTAGECCRGLYKH